MKKVAILVSNVYEKDLRVIRQTESLYAHGYLPYVFCVKGATSAVSEQNSPPKISVFHSTLHLPYIIKRPSELMRYVCLAKSIASCGVGFSAIQSHDLNASLVGYFVSKSLGIPLICDFHELFIRYLAAEEAGLLRKIVLSLYDLTWSSIGKRVVKKAAEFITVNDSLARIYKEQWKLLHNPTVLHNYTSKKHAGDNRLDKRYFRDKFKIDSSRKILLFQGKLFHDKGIETIYEAFKNQHEFAVVFLGFGALVQQVTQYQETHPGVFYYHEPVPGRDLVSYSSCADLGLAPIGTAKGNHVFSSPNKVYEYIAAGIPFVCSDLPEMRKIVDDTAAGVAVPANDPVSLYQAVKDIFMNSKYIKMGEAAREAFRNRYCWEAEEDKLIGLFARVV